MHVAVKTRMGAGIALLGLLMAIGLGLPGIASAEVTCKGHTAKAQDTEDYENALDYVFACTGRIVGYMIVSNREIDAFDTELEVTDTKGTVIGSDGFACEGEIPGTGIGCFGVYGTNNIVRSTFSIAGAKACAEPRIHAKLLVVLETIDAVTGLPRKTSNGAMAGPFDLNRPRGCPRSSPLGGLLAEIAAMKAAALA